MLSPRRETQLPHAAATAACALLLLLAAPSALAQTELSLHWDTPGGPSSIELSPGMHALYLRVTPDSEILFLRVSLRATGGLAFRTSHEVGPPIGISRSMNCPFGDSYNPFTLPGQSDGNCYIRDLGSSLPIPPLLLTYYGYDMDISPQLVENVGVTREPPFPTPFPPPPCTQGCTQPFVMARVWVEVFSPGSVAVEPGSYDVEEAVVESPDPEYEVNPATYDPRAAQIFWNRPLAPSPAPTQIALPSPHANFDPAATLLLTRQAAPFGALGFPNDHPLAVGWDPSIAQWVAVNADATAIPGSTAVNALVVTDEFQYFSFVHESTASNIQGNWTWISGASTNDRPGARVQITPRIQSVGSTANDHPLGVWYDTNRGQWAIFQQDLGSLPEGQYFNVVVPPDTEAVNYVHTVDAGNIDGFRTVLDHPMLNGRPDAMVYVTQNFNPGGSGGVYNPEHVGVVYSPTTERWSLYNESGADMPMGASFNVYSPQRERTVEQQSAAIHAFNYGVLGGPHASGDDGQRLVVTPNLTPEDGSTSVASPTSIGVFFSSLYDAWAIFNEDETTPWEIDSVHNVLDPEVSARSWTHEATPLNSSGSSTRLQHPLLDGQPAAIFVVTQSFNPADTSGVYNDAFPTVAYDDFEARWRVSNDDGPAMPDGASFNVYVAGPDDLAFQVSSTPENTSFNVLTLEHPRLDGRLDRTLLVQSNLTGIGGNGAPNMHPLGVRYDPAIRRWQVVNLDGVAFAEGTTVNVVAVPEAATSVIGPAALLACVILRRRRAPR